MTTPWENQQYREAEEREAEERQRRRIAAPWVPAREIAVGTRFQVLLKGIYLRVDPQWGEDGYVYGVAGPFLIRVPADKQVQPDPG